MCLKALNPDNCCSQLYFFIELKKYFRSVKVWVMEYVLILLALKKISKSSLHIDFFLEPDQLVPRSEKDHHRQHFKRNPHWKSGSFNSQRVLRWIFQVCSNSLTTILHYILKCFRNKLCVVSVIVAGSPSRMWTDKWSLRMQHLRGCGQTPENPSDSPCWRDWWAIQI